jgi:pyrimidine-nucleoside phosphorylase
MKTEADARALAEAIVRVGSRAGKRVSALLTDMESPLGATVGSAIETREAMAVLAGDPGPGAADLVECTLSLGAEMLLLGGRAATIAEARAKLGAAIATGTAARIAERMIEAQGGDPRVVSNQSRLALAPEEVVVAAPRDGFVTRIDALQIGLASVVMGAGRARADQAIDHGVGIALEAKPGAHVAAGAPLARLHVRKQADAAAVAQRVAAAFELADSAPAARPLVLDRIVVANSTAARASE